MRRCWECATAAKCAVERSWKVKEGSVVIGVRGRSAVRDMMDRRGGEGTRRREVGRESVEAALMALRRDDEGLRHARAEEGGVEREKPRGRRGGARSRRRVCGIDQR